MMKKIALSAGMLLFVGAVALGATGAFFSDVETSTGNTFTAGSLDLKVDNTCHYFQDGVDVGCDDGNVQTIENWSETDLVPGVHKFFNFNDIKPGDRGESTISLHVYDNDAWGGFQVVKTGESDVDCTEPEIGAEPNCLATTTEGELDNSMVGRVCLDEGSIPGFQNVGPNGVVIDADPNDEDEDVDLIDPTEGDNICQPNESVLSSQNNGFFNVFYNLSTVLSAAYTAHACTVVNGHVAATSTPGTYGACNGLAQDGRLVGSTTYYFAWEWSLPTSVGNEAQTDSVTGDVQFTVVQHRNNSQQSGLPSQEN